MSLVGRYATDDLPTRFWARVAKSETCWRWTGCIHPDGYGRIMIARRRWISSRLAWVVHFGEVPDGKWVLHKCDNPACVRPDHLFLGTVQDNSADMVAKGRQAFGERHGTFLYPESVPRGERCNLAKLTARRVRAIRRLRALGVKRRVLAARFGVTMSAIDCIMYGKTWRHV